MFNAPVDPMVKLPERRRHNVSAGFFSSAKSSTRESCKLASQSKNRKEKSYFKLVYGSEGPERKASDSNSSDLLSHVGCSHKSHLKRWKDDLLTHSVTSSGLVVSPPRCVIKIRQTRIAKKITKTHLLRNRRKKRFARLHSQLAVLGKSVGADQLTRKDRFWITARNIQSQDAIDSVSFCSFS